MDEQNGIQLITRLLASLRRGVRAWIWFDGVARAALAAAAFVAATLGLDYAFHLDRSQRAILLVAGAAGWATVIVRRLVRPLRAELDDERLCARVEKGFPVLSGGLLAAVQFDRSGGGGASAELVSATIGAGAEAADCVDPALLLDKRAGRQTAGMALAATAAIVAMFALLQPTMSIWLQRNLLLSDTPWPQDTHLFVVGAENGKLKLPIGGDATIRVEARGVIPAEAFLEHGPVGGGKTGSETMSRGREGEFRAAFKNVTEPFRFRALGGDDVTEWMEIVLLPRPELSEVAIRCTPPSYTGLPPQELAGGRSSYAVPEGSALELSATATKPLARAELELQGKIATTLEPGGGKELKFTVPPEALRQGTYAILLTDTEGIPSGAPYRFSLRLKPDEKPRARLTLHGIGDIALPRAAVPMTLSAADDYAISACKILCQIATGDGKNDRELDLPAAEIETKLPAATAEAEHVLDLREFALQPGSRLMLRFRAKDNDAGAGGKEGLSPTLSLRIVTEEELRADFLRREQELRRQFEELAEAQKDILEQTRIARSLGAGDAAAAKQLLAQEKAQRLAGKTADAISRQFAQIVEEVVNNRLEENEKNMEKRISDGIVTPLLYLRDRMMPEAATALSNAAAQSGTGFGEACGKAESQLLAILEKMKEIRQNMVKSESYQEAVAALRQLLKKQEQLLKDSREAENRAVGDVFDE